MVHYSNRNHRLRFLTLLRKVNCCLHKSISHYQGNRVFKINSKSGIFSPKKITITLEVLLYIKSNNRLLQPNELTLSFKYSTAYLVEVHSNVSTSFFDWVIVEMFFIQHFRSVWTPLGHSDPARPFPEMAKQLRLQINRPLSISLSMAYFLKSI